MAVKRLHLVSIQGECHSQGVQILDRSFAQAMDFARAGRAIEAAQLFRQLAEAGHPGALITLGDCYWRGAGAVQDLARGRELFKAASGAGHPMAVRAWTNLLSSGIAGERRWPEALARLENEAIVDGLRGETEFVTTSLKVPATPHELLQGAGCPSVFRRGLRP